METRQRDPQRSFRAGDPQEYRRALAHLAVRGLTIRDYLQASVRWLSAYPDAAIATLERVWPPPQQAGRPGPLVAYAFEDEQGRWHRERDLLPDSAFDNLHTRPFNPRDRYNPMAGQRLVVRCGPLGGTADVTPHLLHVLVSGDSETAVRMTAAVREALYGPLALDTPEWDAWQQARQARRRELAIR